MEQVVLLSMRLTKENNINETATLKPLLYARNVFLRHLHTHIPDNNRA
jgi:hypothetical protein